MTTSSIRHFVRDYVPAPALVSIYIASAEATVNDMVGMFNDEVKAAILGDAAVDFERLFASWVHSAIVRYCMMRSYDVEQEDLVRDGEDSFNEFVSARFQIISEQSQAFSGSSSRTSLRGFPKKM